MKITFLIPFAAMSGGNRVVTIYAQKMIERGHDVLVVSQPRKSPSLRTKLSRWWHRRPINSQKPSAPIFDFLGARHVVLDQRRPPLADDLPDADVVVATWWKTAEWVAALPPEKGKKVYFLQDYETFDRQTEDVVATYNLPLQKFAVSSYIQNAVAQHITADSEQITVIPNAVDHSHFNVVPRQKNDVFTVGFIYTNSPRKNVKLALEALQIAKARLPHLRVIAFGGKAPTAELNLPEWVDYHINPPQKKIVDIYSSCDLWLFTSLHEGFGLPLLEAMACRTPVLATRAGAAPDVIDGNNGVLLDTDADAFADRISFFDEMTDENWLSWSDAAHQSVHSYSWDDATDRLLDFLKDLK